MTMIEPMRKYTGRRVSPDSYRLYPRDREIKSGLGNSHAHVPVGKAPSRWLCSGLGPPTLLCCLGRSKRNAPMLAVSL